MRTVFHYFLTIIVGIVLFTPSSFSVTLPITILDIIEWPLEPIVMKFTSFFWRSYKYRLQHFLWSLQPTLSEFDFVLEERNWIRKDGVRWVGLAFSSTFWSLMPKITESGLRNSWVILLWDWVFNSSISFSWATSFCFCCCSILLFSNSKSVSCLAVSVSRCR